MPLKTSPALLAAMLALAAPAFAQDSATTTETPAAESSDAANGTAGDAAVGVTGGAGTQSGAEDGASDTAATEDATGAAGVEGMAGTQSGAEPAPTETAPAEPETPAEPAAPDATPAPEAAPAEAAPAEPAPADATAAPAPTTDEAAAPTEPQMGAYYVKSTQTDWTVRCINTPDPVDPCEMYQLLRDEGGNSVAEVTMIPLQGQVAAGATIVTPLETDLIAGLNMRVDQGQARAYPFNLCTTIGCVSRVGFTSAELSQLKRGRAATISLVPFGSDPRNPVSLNMSLSGFTAAMTELEENAAAAARENTDPAPEAPAEAPAAN